MFKLTNLETQIHSTNSTSGSISSSSNTNQIGGNNLSVGSINGNVGSSTHNNLVRHLKLIDIKQHYS